MCLLIYIRPCIPFVYPDLSYNSCEHTLHTAVLEWQIKNF